MFAHPNMYLTPQQIVENEFRRDYSNNLLCARGYYGKENYFPACIYFGYVKQMAAERKISVAEIDSEYEACFAQLNTLEILLMTSFDRKFLLPNALVNVVADLAINPAPRKVDEELIALVANHDFKRRLLIAILALKDPMLKQQALWFSLMPANILNIVFSITEDNNCLVNTIAAELIALNDTNKLIRPAAHIIKAFWPKLSNVQSNIRNLIEAYSNNPQPGASYLKAFSAFNTTVKFADEQASLSGIAQLPRNGFEFFEFGDNQL